MNNRYILPYKNELYRKGIHLCSILFPIFYIYTNFNLFIYLITTATIAIIIIDCIKDKKSVADGILGRYLTVVYRPYEKNGIMGATYMLIGFMIISITMNKIPAIFGMFVVIFSDSASALIGIRYGKIYLVNNKTLEGTFAFAICTLLIIFLMNLSLNLAQIVLVASLCSLTELLTPTKYDNLSISIVSGFLIGIMI